MDRVINTVMAMFRVTFRDATAILYVTVYNIFNVLKHICKGWERRTKQKWDGSGFRVEWGY